MARGPGLFGVKMCLATMGGLRRSGTRLADRGDVVLSLRIARHLVRRELGRTDPTRDWGTAGDSLWLRAFRGVGLVCPGPSRPNEWIVAYRGERDPDPSKDSIEVTYPDGTIRYAALTGVGSAPGGCGVTDSTETMSLWRIDPALPTGPVLTRLFERGSYHFSLSALRYRRGRGGRQPLTPEVWKDGATGWRTNGPRLGLELIPARVGAGQEWGGFLSWLGSP